MACRCQNCMTSSFFMDQGKLDVKPLMSAMIYGSNEWRQCNILQYKYNFDVPWKDSQSRSRGCGIAQGLSAVVLHPGVPIFSPLVSQFALLNIILELQRTLKAAGISRHPYPLSSVSFGPIPGLLRQYSEQSPRPRDRARRIELVQESRLRPC